MTDPAPGSDAETAWARNVMDEMSGLRPIDRAVLKLIYWRGLTQLEVARELALPDHAVRRCVARGMRELAGNLADAPAHRDTTS